MKREGLPFVFWDKRQQLRRALIYRNRASRRGTILGLGFLCGLLDQNKPVFGYYLRVTRAGSKLQLDAVELLRCRLPVNGGIIYY